MITALQHFISKKGKFVFVLLLLLVVVSFVLYLSQGSSVFDLMSDGGREKKEFYGYDWNDPDQRRFLNVTTRAAGAVGVLASPVQNIVEQADSQYIEGLQQQIQAAFRANPGDVDQDALQRMFQYMQAWPNFSRDFKIREIARSGAYDAEFLEESVKTRVLLSGQADNWNFLDGSINHPSINSQFVRFLSSIDPSMNSEENRTQALSIVGSRFGMSGSELESVLYSSFRDMLVDRVFTDRGFALSKEIEVLSQQNAFAWDGEVVVLSRKELPSFIPVWGEVSITENPKEGDTFELFDGNKKIKIEFVKKAGNSNETSVPVTVGGNPKQTAKNLSDAINREDLSIRGKPNKNAAVTLELKREKLPAKAPLLNSSSQAISFTDWISPRILDFFENNSDADVFMEKPRTFATAMVFSTKKFLSTPPPADDARLRSYFERNRIDFILDSETADHADKNETDQPEIKFEDVADKVREKVEKQDLADATREAERLAQNAALKFLDELNTFSDRIRKNYPDFISLRNSADLKNFLSESGAEQRKISFTAKDMNVQSMVLGLEKRSSELRNNKEPLLEVESLTDSKFFTRSVRKSRNGYIVFVLDRKTEKQPAEFTSISFSTLCSEYIRDQENETFNQKMDEVLSQLNSNRNEMGDYAVKYKIEAKNQSTARASFDSKQRMLRSKIEGIEAKQSSLKETDQKLNSEDEKELSKLRDQLADLTKERKAVDRLLQGADALKVDNTWVEIERNQDSAFYGLLSNVYSLRGKDFEDGERDALNSNLELSRGMLARDEVVGEILFSSLSQ